MSWTVQNAPLPFLQGLRVLVVEDEAIIALQIEDVLTDAGASVVGPAGNVEDALALVRREDLSAAVLDVRLGAETVEPVAEALFGRKVPFVFYSGQVESDAALRRWPKAAFLAKPAPSRHLIKAIGKVLATGEPVETPDRPRLRPIV